MATKGQQQDNTEPKEEVQPMPQFTQEQINQLMAMMQTQAPTKVEKPKKGLAKVWDNLKTGAKKFKNDHPALDSFINAVGGGLISIGICKIGKDAIDHRQARQYQEQQMPQVQAYNDLDPNN